MKSKTLVGLLRAALGVALLGGIVWVADLDRLRTQWQTITVSYVALALGAQLLAKCVWTYRWQLILAALDEPRGFLHLFRLIHIGLFFNWFFPSFIGGDVARGYLSKSGAAGGSFATYAVVVSERLLGLVTLLGVAVLGCGLVAAHGDTPEVAKRLFLLTAIGLVAGFLGALLLGRLTAGHHHRWLGLLSDRIASKLVAMGDDLKRALRLPPNVLYPVLGLSIVLHLLGIWFHYYCAAALGLDVAVLHLWAIVPLAVFIAMIPVSLNGLGLREGTLVGLLALLGVPVEQGALFALLALAISLIFAVAGGLLMLIPGSTRERLWAH